MKSKHSADLQGFKLVQYLPSCTHVICQPASQSLYPEVAAGLTSVPAVASKMGFQKAHDLGLTQLAALERCRPPPFCNGVNQCVPKLRQTLVLGKKNGSFLLYSTKYPWRRTNKVFAGHQPCQVVKIHRRFRDHLITLMLETDDLWNTGEF
jgi:hypothetical protein